MATRSIVTSQPDVACDVCGRRLLRGEQPDVFLAQGQRRTVCELCAPRASAEGWLRETDDPEVGLPPPRPRRGRSLLDRWRQPRERPSLGGDLEPVLPLAPEALASETLAPKPPVPEALASETLAPEPPVPEALASEALAPEPLVPEVRETSDPVPALPLADADPAPAKEEPEQEPEQEEEKEELGSWRDAWMFMGE